MTPSSDPPEHDSKDLPGPAARDELVDLLASCALDGVDADPQDLRAAEAAGVTAADIERRRATFAHLRESLLEEVVDDPVPDVPDEVSERRRERAILAAVTASARPAKQRLGTPPSAPAPQRLDRQRRLAPALVAAGVLAVAGLGALVVSGGGDTEDTASTPAEVQLDGAEVGGLPTTTSAPAAARTDDEATEADRSQGFDSSAEAGAPDAPPSPMVRDLGSLDNLNAAFDALAGGELATGPQADGEADTTCVLQMAIEGYRAVATVRIGTTTHLVGETATGELAAFRSSDCTVVARRSG